jgi:hypothetical protein
MLWHRSLVTPTPSSDGDVVREEAASIAATQVPVYASVDVTSAPDASRLPYLGVSDRSVRGRKIRSTTMLLAVDQYNMAGLRGVACPLGKTLNELLNDDDSSAAPDRGGS